MTRRGTRRGYTLFELIVVMVILLILAAVLIPSLSAFRGDSRQKAAADVIRTEIATARARAKEEGQPYRVAISEDGRRIRRAPDTEAFAEAGAFNQPGGTSPAVEYEFEHATASRVAEQDAAPLITTNGWVTLACVQPDGTCREDTVLVEIKDGDSAPIYLRVRGVTGSAKLVPNPNTAAGANGGAR
jgi:prepilin-type N-terminal cleavage/methylation domain-containing protein